MGHDSREELRRSLDPLRLIAVVTVVAISMLGVLVDGAAPAGSETPASSTSWSVVPSPSAPGRANADLLGVACHTASDCVVVGGGPVVGSDDDLQPIVGDFTGPDWALTPLVPPSAPSTIGTLAGVACATPTTCFGVGSSNGTSAGTLIARWNGTTWSRMTSPRVTAGTAVLSAVACPSSTKCFAVGRVTNGARVSTLVERWVPSGWSVSASPNPHGSAAQAFLFGISCPSSTSCFAVGSASDRTSETTWIEHWNGTNWSTAASPKSPAGVIPQLSAISCATPTSCVAVGLSFARAQGLARPRLIGSDQILIERWNGKVWAVSATSLASGTADSAFNGVACPAANDCFAVGWFAGQESGFRTLVARWNGKSWVRYPASVFGGLNAVSCRGAKRCVATGTSGLVDVWDGSKWSPTSSGGAAALLSQVSCTSATSCLAIGSADDLSQPVVERWDGVSWSTVATPVASVRSFFYLLGVSCVSSTTCFVVGERTSVDGGGLSPLALEWNGSSWTTLPTPALSNIYGGLLDVSCASSTSCFAVGYYFGEPTATLVEHWNGTSWSLVASPNPGASDNVLYGIACVSATSCYAVGFRGAGVGGSADTTLIEHWNGSAWSLMTSPSVAGTGDALAHVSCVSDSSCFAVGGVSSSSTAGALVEQWNGSIWAIVPVSTPSGSQFAGLTGISCVSAVSCVAVGTQSTVGKGESLIERWNGSAWSGDSTPAIGDTDSLSGVSCVPAPAGCFAVGSYESLGSQFTLVERSS